jgi:hypothetical protein
LNSSANRVHVLEGHVELVGEPGGQRRRPLGPLATDDDRRVWPLRGLGQRGGVGHLVVPPGVRVGLALWGAPEAGDDLQLFLAALEPLAHARKRHAVGLVLTLEPAGTEAELDAPAGHLVDLRHGDRERTGIAEGRRRHQRAEADTLGLPGQRAQRDPGVGRARPAVHRAGLHEVVRAEERAVARVLRALGHDQLVLVAGALLGLGKHPQIHRVFPFAHVVGRACRTPIPLGIRHVRST